MGDTYGVRLSQRQQEVIEDMQARGDADSDSEALRELLDTGAAQYGYVGPYRSETTLKAITSRFAQSFALVGLIWLATTVYLPAGLRWPAVFAFAASAGLYGFERVLGEYEPAISNRLRGLVGRQAVTDGGEEE